MSSNLVILGPESSVIYYNLNKQFATVPKIIVTSEIILSAFEEADLKSALSSLASVDAKNYNQKANEILQSEVFNSSITPELSKQIQAKFPEISDNMMDIQLQNYSFMNSVSNTKFNVTLRTESFSQTKYYIEKASITSAIRHLLKDYIKYEGNAFRLSKLSNFQIEVYESQEVYKHITLKKEGNSLILVSNFGFDLTNPIDHNVSGEIYFSKGESFQLYPNKQSVAIIKDHAHLKESQIHKQAKILTDENLVLINDNTKNINDAIIELYLTRKGNLKILNLSILENSLDGGNENGFVINKSSKNYDKISITGLRDNLDEEFSNPKYLLIRNSNEVKEIISNPLLLTKVDGLIFTESFYSPFFDKLGQALDIDIIYYKHELSKALEVKVDISNLEIESGLKSKSSASNPFSSIITESRKEKDEYLERLKNIDLSTPPRPAQQIDSQISNIAEQLISSPNSSVNKSSATPLMEFGSSGLGGKKSAIGMLAAAVLNGTSNSAPAAPPQPAPVAPVSPPPIQEQPYSDFSNSELVMQGVTSKDVNPISEESFTQAFGGFESSPLPSNLVQEVTQENEMEKSCCGKGDCCNDIDLSIYDDVLATKVIAPPGVDSEYYFANSSNLAEVSGGEIFLMTSSVENLGNSHLNYVLPIDLFEDGLEDNYFILNSTDDFVSLNRDDLKCFVNICSVDPRIKKSFLEKCASYMSVPICVIANKEDLEILKDSIHRIDAIFVQDIAYDEDLAEVKQKVLEFEKRYLMRN